MNKHNDSLLCCNPKRLGSKSAIKSKREKKLPCKTNKQHLTYHKGLKLAKMPFLGYTIAPASSRTAVWPSRQEVAGPLVVAAAALSTSVVVGELSAQEMGCHGACLLAIILAS